MKNACQNAVDSLLSCPTQNSHHTTWPPARTSEIPSIASITRMKPVLKLCDKVLRLQIRGQSKRVLASNQQSSHHRLRGHLYRFIFDRPNSPESSKCTRVQRQKQKLPFIPSNQSIHQAQVLQLNPTTFDRPVPWVSDNQCDAKLWLRLKLADEIVHACVFLVLPSTSVFAFQPGDRKRI